jgi:membrane dipeptidase
MKIIDMHCDTISKLCECKGTCLRKNDFCVDIEKLKKGNYAAQFFAMFIYLKNGKDPLETCLHMIDRCYVELDKNRNDIQIAKNYDDMVENQSEEKISAFLTIEEGAAIKGKVENLRNFYRLGVRLMTLTWNFPNEIGYPNCKEEFMNKGLTDFGKEVVFEMNRLGMIIDTSHLSDGGFYDVAKLSKKSFVASHSNARAVTDHSRNLTDDMIKILSEKGGVMGINFEKNFLGNDGMSRVEHMVKHIKHIKNVGGIDVIALGTDFDGISPELEIKDAGEMDKLIFALQKSGFSEDDIEKILYKNTMRVIKDVMK